VIGAVRPDTGETIDLQGRLIDALSLGYGMTLHKAQGSDFGRVIVLLQDTKLLDRSWIYTAITRAVSEVHIIGIGDPLVFERFVKASPKAFLRKTMLTNLIDYLRSEQSTVDCAD
jgi:exodeoxyribonuclease V alpha subunit